MKRVLLFATLLFSAGGVSCFAQDFLNFIEGHEYVDLGLSVKWATCNVGAQKPEEYGDYYAWGETETKSDYSWKTYKYCKGNWTNLTKCNSVRKNGTVDKKSVLDPTDDAAHANWKGSWYMPTKGELEELMTQCTWEKTTLNGVVGYKVSGKKPGYTDRSIFIPAAGRYEIGSVYHKGTNVYLSSMSLGDESDGAYMLIYGDDEKAVKCGYREYGPSVRPVSL